MRENLGVNIWRDKLTSDHLRVKLYIILKSVLQGDLDVLVKKFVFKKISMIEIPKSSKLHRYVNKVRKLYHARYKCNNKRDPKI